jgi:hypothetical protein
MQGADCCTNKFAYLWTTSCLESTGVVLISSITWAEYELPQFEVATVNKLSMSTSSLESSTQCPQLVRRVPPLG